MHSRIEGAWSIVSSYVWCEIWFLFFYYFFLWKYHSSILDGLFSFIYFSIFSSIYHSSIFVFSLFSNHFFFVQWTLLPQLLFWTLKKEGKEKNYNIMHVIVCCVHLFIIFIWCVKPYKCMCFFCDLTFTLKIYIYFIYTYTTWSE